MIYLIRSGQYVKIGISECPRKRIASIQTSNPEPIELLATAPGGRELEARLHSRFANLRHNREWFHDDISIREEIARLSGAEAVRQLEPDGAVDNWRFEIKRKPRRATRRNAGSTAEDEWYYWVIRVHSDGRSLYYGTLDTIAAAAVEAAAAPEAQP